VKPHGQTIFLFTSLLLSAAAVSVPARADQFVLIDLTYEANAQNTMDSHFFGTPAANIPKNLKSPVDYSTGTAYVRFEVLAKPSAAKTLYNICFSNPSNYACMPYPPAYTATGVNMFNAPFSAFWQGNLVDWTMGISQVQLVLKDEKENKVQGDPMFYPYKMHVTITLVSPGATYVPPAAAGAGGSSAGASGAASGGRGGAGGSVGTAGAAGSRAGGGTAGGGTAGAVSGAAGSTPAPDEGAAGSPGSATGPDNSAGSASPGVTVDAGSDPSATGDTADPDNVGELPPQGVTQQPNKREAPVPGNIQAGCSTVAPVGQGHGARELAALSCVVVLAGAERSRRRRRWNASSRARDSAR
jgi:hypothetical protein